MKQLLIIIAVVVLVGCGESPHPPPTPEAKLVEPVTEAAQPGQFSKPLSEADSALLDAATEGKIEAVKQHLDAGADVNAKDGAGRTPLDKAKRGWLRDSPEVIAARKETADLLRKHGGKTGEELKATGN